MRKRSQSGFDFLQQNESAYIKESGQLVRILLLHEVLSYKFGNWKPFSISIVCAIRSNKLSLNFLDAA